MADARRTLELFNRLNVILDILLTILFLITGVFGLTLIMPTTVVVNMCLQAVATVVLVLFGVACVKTAERITLAMRGNIEQAVEDEKTDEEKMAPVVVSKKAISAEAPVAPTLSNKVLKTTRVVLKNTSGPAVGKRGRPKKEG